MTQLLHKFKFTVIMYLTGGETRYLATSKIRFFEVILS